MLATRISVPILREYLRSEGKAAEAEAVERLRPQMFGPGYASRILTDFDVDAPEGEVQVACPSLSTGNIRRFAYPAVFYRDVRSPLVHEYQLGKQAAPVAMTERQAGVSYVNRGARRLVYYHLDWLIEVVRSIAVDSSGHDAPLDRPARWWLDG